MDKSNAEIHGKNSERAAIRNILSRSWNTKATGNTGPNGPFRLVYSNDSNGSGNHKFVYDSSTYTRYSKELAMNRFIVSNKD